MIHTESKFYDGVEVRAQKPFDVRTIQERREDLYDINMWPHDTYIDENGDEHYTIYMKEGMTVTVTGTKENPVFEQYMLIDLSKMLNKDYSGWKLLGTGSTPGGAVEHSLEILMVVVRTKHIINHKSLMVVRRMEQLLEVKLKKNKHRLKYGIYNSTAQRYR